MNRKQWQKFVGWIAFSVILPILVYPAAAVIAYFAGSSFSLRDALSSGDLLFLVVIMQAAALNWIILDFRERPQKSKDESVAKDILNYVWFAWMLLGLIFYTMIYGWIVTQRMSNSLQIRNLEALQWFCVFSLIGWSCFCGGLYYHLLKQGRV